MRLGPPAGGQWRKLLYWKQHSSAQLARQLVWQHAVRSSDEFCFPTRWDWQVAFSLVWAWKGWMRVVRLVWGGMGHGRTWGAGYHRSYELSAGLPCWRASWSAEIGEGVASMDADWWVSPLKTHRLELP